MFSIKKNGCSEGSRRSSRLREVLGTTAVAALVLAGCTADTVPPYYTSSIYGPYNSRQTPTLLIFYPTQDDTNVCYGADANAEFPVHFTMYNAPAGARVRLRLDRHRNGGTGGITFGPFDATPISPKKACRPITGAPADSANSDCRELELTKCDSDDDCKTRPKRCRAATAATDCPGGDFCARDGFCGRTTVPFEDTCGSNGYCKKATSFTVDTCNTGTMLCNNTFRVPNLPPGDPFGIGTPQTVYTGMGMVSLASLPASERDGLHQVDAEMVDSAGRPINVPVNCNAELFGGQTCQVQSTKHFVTFTARVRSMCDASCPEFGPPEVADITPTSGPATGGTMVTITGTGFLEGAKVQFVDPTTEEAFDLTNVTVVDDTTITATTPPGTGAGLEVIVTNCDEQQGVLEEAWTYE